MPPLNRYMDQLNGPVSFSVPCDEVSRRGAGAAEFEEHKREAFSANSAPLRGIASRQARSTLMAECRKNLPATLGDCDHAMTSHSLCPAS